MKESLNLESEFKTSLIQIFKDAQQNKIPYSARGFCLPKIIIKNTLLFIGINPSYSKNTSHYNHFYSYSQNGNEHPYYRKFAKISEEVQLEWSHVDMLFYQETSQKSYHEIERSNGGKDFIEKQLEITRKILEKAKPKIIIVSNTLSRTLFRDNLKLECEFDQTIGTQCVKKGILKGTPVFFTSMLTGQRALDNGSFERLIWHINYILKIKLITI
jgi:CRISPR/Cas system CSM-associated protein Csm5 (group 7 of RAMP superfamily)